MKLDKKNYLINIKTVFFIDFDIYIYFYSSFEVSEKHGKNKNKDEYVIIKEMMFTVNAVYHIISSSLFL